MLFNNNKIKITVKLFSDLHKIANIKSYDPYKGIKLEVEDGLRIKKLIKKLSVADQMPLAFFVNGDRVGLWYKLKDGDELSCLRPTAGG